MDSLLLQQPDERAERRAGSSRFYYGWVLVLALGVTETVSYGILSYSFPVFLVPMEAEFGWSRTALTGAFSVASLIAGLAAIPLGRWIDRRGARGVMTAGSLLAVGVLLGWSRVQDLTTFYLLAMGLGVAMAAVLYEPAFAVVANWFVRLRGRALTVLTFLGGFASVIFVPLASGLVEMYGWRSALLWLAGILAVVTVPLHAILLRRRPEDLGLAPDGGADPRPPGPSGPGDRYLTARDAVRGPSFRWLALAFGLSTVATTGLAVHLIPLLIERGHGAAFAAAAMGALGLFALPGRLVFTPLGSRWPRPFVTAAIFGLSALGVAALLATRSTLGVWLFVVLFGAGFGAITPARAALVAEMYGTRSYATISGAMALVLALARAAAPVGLSLLYEAAGDYHVVLWLLLLAAIASGGAVLLAGASSPAATGERLELGL